MNLERRTNFCIFGNSERPFISMHTFIKNILVFLFELNIARKKKNKTMHAPSRFLMIADKKTWDFYSFECKYTLFLIFIFAMLIPVWSSKHKIKKNNLKIILISTFFRKLTSILRNCLFTAIQDGSRKYYDLVSSC